MLYRISKSQIYRADSPLNRYQSSSCAVRSAVSCYNLGEKLKFPESWLKNGKNSIILSLPFNATDIETAVLPVSSGVQKR
jgi:rhamnogalacturonan endolyase